MARRKNKPLSPTLYLIIGAAVAIFSRIVLAADKENTPMILFFWIGVAMALMGLGKLGMKKFLKKEEKSVEKDGQRFEQQLHRQEQSFKKQHEHPAQHNIVACPNCGTRHYSSSNFCHKCGSRLK